MDNPEDPSSALTTIMASICILPAHYHFSTLIYVNKLLSKSVGQQMPCPYNNRCHFSKTCWFKHNFVNSTCRPGTSQQIESSQSHHRYHISPSFSQRHRQKEVPAAQPLKEKAQRPNGSPGTVPFAPARHTGPVIKNTNLSSLQDKPREESGSRSRTLNDGSQESIAEWIIATKHHHPRINTQPDQSNNALEGE